MKIGDKVTLTGEVSALREDGAICIAHVHDGADELQYSDREQICLTAEGRAAFQVKAIDAPPENKARKKAPETK